jgi:hypothetical protein
MENVLSSARVAIENAQTNEEIKGFIINYGYDDERLQEGLELLKTADDLYQAQKSKRGEQITVSNQLQEKFDHAYNLYIGYVKLARLVLKDDPGAITTLGLVGERKRTFPGFIAQAKQFYLNAMNNEEIFEKIKKFAITKEKLQAGLDLLSEIEKTDSFQESKKGASQDATLLRNTAFKKLMQWMSEFTQASRIALASRPQLLETLGILARSEGYKRKSKNENEEETEDLTESE